MERKRRIGIDFDGVIHSYKSGWKAPHIVSDEPVEGAIDWLKTMIDAPDLEVYIFSSRILYDGGERAISAWLIKHGLGLDYLHRLMFTGTKIPMDMMIDDRCWQFVGQFPTVDFVRNFEPWHKVGISSEVYPRG